MNKIYLIVAFLSSVIVSTSNAQPTPKPVVSPQRLNSVRVDKIVYRSVSRPRYDVSGSLARAYNKRSLINHLVSTHGLKASEISRLSINQLWFIHDTKHDEDKLVETVYCPPGGS